MFYACFLQEFELFAVHNRIFPTGGYAPMSEGFGEWLKYLVLPAISYGSTQAAYFARLMRSSMLEVIRADYITTARSKGLTEREVTYKHALPNALIPVITLLGGHFGNLLGGSLVVETIFGIPGMGLYIVNGINNRDYPVVQSCVIMLGIVFSLCMLLVDIAYAYVDPRIKAQYTNSVKRRGKT